MIFTELDYVIKSIAFFFVSGVVLGVLYENFAIFINACKNISRRCVIYLKNGYKNQNNDRYNLAESAHLYNYFFTFLGGIVILLFVYALCDMHLRAHIIISVWSGILLGRKIDILYIQKHSRKFTVLIVNIT